MTIQNRNISAENLQVSEQTLEPAAAKFCAQPGKIAATEISQSANSDVNKRAPSTHSVAENFIRALIPARYSKSSPSIPVFSLARLAHLPRDASMTYGMGRIDASGRVADRSIVQRLGWMHGDRLDITIVSGIVLIRPNPDGAFVLSSKPYVIIPAPVRRWCGISAGDKVLLAAAPESGVLVIHTMATLDTMIVNYHSKVDSTNNST